MSKKWTVEDVTEWISKTFTPAYVVTGEGQAHLNRVGKAITNESLDARKKKQQKTLAEAAFNKALAKVASEPEKVAELLAKKDTWIESYIARKYGTDED